MLNESSNKRCIYYLFIAEYFLRLITIEDEYV